MSQVRVPCIVGEAPRVLGVIAFSYNVSCLAGIFGRVPSPCALYAVFGLCLGDYKQKLLSISGSRRVAHQARQQPGAGSTEGPQPVGCLFAVFLECGHGKPSHS